MRLGSAIGISKQTEILMFSIFGIVFTILDASLLDLNQNLTKIWNVKMESNKFSLTTESGIKYWLCGIVIIRSLSVHLFLGCYIILLYPVVFEARPALLMPWMVVTCFKNLLTGLMSLSAGSFICMIYKFAQPICLEFVISQCLDNAPSLYMFLLVRQYYRELSKRKCKFPSRSPSLAHLRRRKTREVKLNQSSYIFEEKKLGTRATIDNLIFNLSRKGDDNIATRSLDTLLNILRDGDIRTDPFSVFDDLFEDDPSMSIQERVLKVLSMTERNIKIDESNVEEKSSEEKKECKSLSLLDEKRKEKETRRTNRELAKKEMINNDLLSIQSEVELRTIAPDSSIHCCLCIDKNDISTQNKQTVEEIASLPTSLKKSEYKAPQSLSWDPNCKDVSEKNKIDEFELKEFYKNEENYPGNFNDDVSTVTFCDLICKKNEANDSVRDT